MYCYCINSHGAAGNATPRVRGRRLVQVQSDRSPACATRPAQSQVCTRVLQVPPDQSRCSAQFDPAHENRHVCADLCHVCVLTSRIAIVFESAALGVRQ